MKTLTHMFTQRRVEHIHTRKHLHTKTHTHKHIHARTHAHTHTHTHTYIENNPLTTNYRVTICKIKQEHKIISLKKHAWTKLFSINSSSNKNNINLQQNKTNKIRHQQSCSWHKRLPYRHPCLPKLRATIQKSTTLVMSNNSTTQAKKYWNNRFTTPDFQAINNCNRPTFFDRETNQTHSSFKRRIGEGGIQRVTK